MKGKLIIIEAGDGSGKETQSKRLYQRLKDEGYNARIIRFPNYGSDSSALVRMYLRGDFGSRPDDVNAYASSVFFAVDRFASYKTDWKDFYESGGIILADRYTTSNMVHQAAKLEDPDERKRYLEWLYDLEFVKLGLPVPDCVILLDMPPEYAQRLIKDRSNKITGQEEKDIHEKDEAYLEKVYRTTKSLAEAYGWHRIACTKDGGIRSIEDIHEDVYEVVKNLLDSKQGG
ncbi:MAG TPA: thymidylate kinase [Candidatus Atribacteria bacterium]|nr:thymidylate kinase [Candidatus Atribacteria bacterium]